MSNPIYNRISLDKAFYYIYDQITIKILDMVNNKVRYPIYNNVSGEVIRLLLDSVWGNTGKKEG